jgi:hypothetical protein
MYIQYVYCMSTSPLDVRYRPHAMCSRHDLPGVVTFIYEDFSWVKKIFPGVSDPQLQADLTLSAVWLGVEWIERYMYKKASEEKNLGPPPPPQRTTSPPSLRPPDKITQITDQ